MQKANFLPCERWCAKKIVDVHNRGNALDALRYSLITSPTASRAIFSVRSTSAASSIARRTLLSSANPREIRSEVICRSVIGSRTTELGCNPITSRASRIVIIARSSIRRFSKSPSKSIWFASRINSEINADKE